jgi:hypothetical protein
MNVIILVGKTASVDEPQGAPTLSSPRQQDAQLAKL